MFKNKSKWVGVVLALVMVLAFTTPIFAEGGVDSVEPSEVVEETSTFFDHPIFKWIVKLIFNPFEVVGEDPDQEVGDVDLIGEEPRHAEGPLGGSDSTEGTPELIPVVVLEEAVAAVHVDGDLEFGKIVELLEIAENAQAVCDENNKENCEVTLGSLLIEYEDGTGVVELFEKHGKSENLGVGQVQKELSPKDTEKTNNVKIIRKD